MTDIIVVGGGASGMVASIVAARNGGKVLLIERLNRIGKKLLVTGNGRCNLTNIDLQEAYYHTGSTGDFFRPLKERGYKETKDFFEALGIVPLIEEKKVYPFSEQASSVLDVLRMELEQLGVSIQTDTKIVDVFRKAHEWHVVSEAGTTYKADKLIFATGGLAGPSFGCDSTGYKMLQKIGHTLIPPFPTLVHMLSTSSYCKMMKGTKITCMASVWTEGKKIRQEYGEVLFTEDGLSGPPIFQLSRVAAKAKEEHKKCLVSLDLLPDKSEEEIVSHIYSRIAGHPNRTLEELFMGWLHKRVAVPLIKSADIGSMHTKCENLEYEMIEKLAKSMKDFRFEVTGTRGYKYAQATAGGIALEEINFETMASKKVEGLYLTGELIDIDGDCGGFNLQWAWSTGYIAGMHASQKK